MKESVPLRWSRLIIALFLAMLWTPFIGMFFYTGELASGYESKTAFAWRRDELSAYLRDHFGFRGPLITAQALLKVRVLGISTSKDVELGANGWLFYAKGGAIEATQGRYPFFGQQLDSWLDWMGDNSKWMRDHGIASAFVVPPDKATIYPEFMPVRIYAGPSRLDQLEHAIAERPEVQFVNLRRTLEEAKGPENDHAGRIYYLTDTHWNAAGAYAAYRTILPLIAGTEARPPPYSEVVSGTEVFVGDLARMLGLSTVWKEQRDRLVPASSFANTAPTGARKVVIFGDSFAISLEPLLSRHFRIIRTRTPMIDRALLEREHPDFVLVEFIERALNTHPPTEP